MPIAKLSLVNVIGDVKCLDEVLIRCLERGDFHPERPLQGDIRGFLPLTGENPYAGLLSELSSLGARAGIPLRYRPELLGRPSGQSPGAWAAEAGAFGEEFHAGLDRLRERAAYLRGEIDQDESARVILTHLAELEVSFDEIFSCRYTKVRFGRLPADSYRKLGLYEEKPFIFKAFDLQKDYCWGAYFSLPEDTPLCDDIFSSLYFERMRVPQSVHGTPEAALSQLARDIERNREQLGGTEGRIAALAAERRDRFDEAYTRVKFLSDSHGMRQYVSVLKRDFLDVFHITGFVERKDARDFAEEIGGVSGVTVEVLPEDSDRRVSPPTRLKNGWFSRPFEIFVEMYGLPAYNDLDPTPFVAFTYSLLFGIMFGDLGQGLLLILAGWLFWRLKGMRLGQVVSRIGIFSCVFGALYGSFFGNEEFLTPFYTGVLGLPGKPIEVMAPENTNLILISAVALGVLLICSSILIDIAGSLRRHELERALFSANGVAGLLFYGGVLFGAAMRFIAGINLFTFPYVLLAILLPLGLILFKEPLGRLLAGLAAKPEEGMGSYLMVGTFELAEVVLSFFSNTMSFLRVGGFVLSHAGMMAVVYTLSDMVGGAGSPVVLVLGNLFVIGMEGLIVGIQVLRLEFYEMFSRYFDGGGRPFRTVSVHSVTGEE